MLYPSIDELMKKLDSKYSLVVAASRRARALKDGAPASLEEVHSKKYVGIAMEEIYEGKIKFKEVN